MPYFAGVSFRDVNKRGSIVLRTSEVSTEMQRNISWDEQEDINKVKNQVSLECEPRGKCCVGHNEARMGLSDASVFKALLAMPEFVNSTYSIKKAR